MLSEEITKLLTAYVDGELSPRQRDAVLRLLHRSAEARELVRQLQENAHTLKQLPLRQLEPDFADDVVRVIESRRLPPRRPASRRRWLHVGAAASAAAVLLLAFGSLYYYAVNAEPSDPAPVAVNKKQEPPVEPREELPVRRPPNPLIAQLVDGVYSQYAAPIPPERTVSVAFADLRRDEETAERVAAELQKAPAVDLDVVVQDSPRAVERLQAAFRDAGIKLVIDPGSAATLKNDQGRAEYWVYAENVKPEELTRVLKILAAPEKAARLTPFEKLTVTPLEQTEQRQVVALLGIDPARTIGSTQGILPGNNVKLPPVTKERVAVVLPQAAAPRASEEVRQFLYQPNRPQPGTLRVLVKIHQ